MTQIIGNGDPVGDFPEFFDANIDFSPFGLTDRFEFKSANITRSADGPVFRISEITPISGARSLVQGNAANRPVYLAGGGPNSLSDAAEFVSTRPDGFVLGDIAATTHTKILIINPVMPAADNVNMHLLSTVNAGNGRNAMYLRRVSGALTLQCYIGDTPVNGAIANVSVPAGSWSAVAMTVNIETRTVSAGVRVSGAANWTWATAVWPEGFGPNVLAHTLGARDALTTLDGLNGRIAGGLVLTSDMRTNADLTNAVNAWAFGDQSIFGM